MFIVQQADRARRENLPLSTRGGSERARGGGDRIAGLETKLDELTKALADRDARIAELERLLEQSQRSDKHQAAPFSKGEPSDEPAKPGCKNGVRADGRHGHR